MPKVYSREHLALSASPHSNIQQDLTMNTTKLMIVLIGAGLYELYRAVKRLLADLAILKQAKDRVAATA